MFVSVILPDYRLAREVVYTSTFSRMDNTLEGPSRRFDAATVVSMIESGLFSGFLNEMLIFYVKDLLL